MTAVVGRARGAPSFAPLTPRDQRRDNAGHGRRPSVLMRTSAKQIVRLEAVLILPDPVQGCDLLRPISALRTVPDVTQGHGPCLGWRDVRYYSTESARLLRTVWGVDFRPKTTFLFNAGHERRGIRASATNSRFAVTDDMADHGALASVGVRLVAGWTSGASAYAKDHGVSSSALTSGLKDLRVQPVGEVPYSYGAGPFEICLS